MLPLARMGLGRGHKHHEGEVEVRNGFMTTPNYHMEGVPLLSCQLIRKGFHVSYSDLALLVSGV